VLFHSPPGVLFTFPSRYWFAIGRQEYLALDGGPPGFPHERPSTWYSGTRPRVGSLSRTGLSPTTAGLSMPLLLTNRLVTLCETHRSREPALQHRDCNGCDLSRSHGLGSSAFARHYSRNVSLFLEVLRCFSSLGVLDRPMYSVGRTQALPWMGCPIRRSSDQRLLAAPRSISSPATSFIGSWRQGIHRTPLVA
jgi:hypothetical protein